MKKTKIIIPAMGMLLLGTAASVTGTVAWFSMSNSVPVTGMQVQTKVSSNLRIAEINAEENYSNDLTQTRSGVLEPVSSINGVAFYYTTNALGNGDAKTDSYTQYSEDTTPTASSASETSVTGAHKTQYDDDFNTEYSHTVASTTSDVYFGYIDYSFYLKGYSSSDDQVLSLSKCNMLYNSSAITSGFSWRVALFAQSTSASTNVADGTAVAAGNLITILDFENKSRNQNEVSYSAPAADTVLPGDPEAYFMDPQCTTPAASGTADGTTKYYQKTGQFDTPKAVDSGATLANVLHPNDEANIADDVDSGATVYYKVVVRLWLEGEDVDCKSDTFAVLASNWTLDLEFKLSDADGVQYIGSVAA